MGQKIHPTGFRLAVTRNWGSKWFANSKNYPGILARGHQGPRVPGQEAVARLGGQDHDRAPGEERAHHDPQRASGRRHRQEGRGHRDAPRRPAQDDGRRRRPQHRGDPQAGDRRAAHRRLDRAAAREADHVPPRHEARDAERDAPRRPGHQGDVVGPPERRGNRAPRVVPRRPRAAAYAARRHRLRFFRSAHDVRRHRHQGVGVQGRT